MSSARTPVVRAYRFLPWAGRRIPRSDCTRRTSEAATNRRRIERLRIAWRLHAAPYLIRAAALLGCAILPNAASASNSAAPVVVNCNDQVDVPLPEDPLGFLIQAPSRGAWLVVHEIGQDLDLGGLPDPAISIQVP